MNMLNKICVVCNTGDEDLDGTKCKVVGISKSELCSDYKIYIVERLDNELWFDGYKVHPFIYSCLRFM